MKFWKMNGAGNDFIILNNLEEHLPSEAFPQIARTLCERRLSIGADGLMVVEAPLCGGDYRMLFYNADGSEGEMCGNGARCICRYGYETGLAGETQKVETISGTVTGTRIDRRRYRVRLNSPTVMRLDASVEVDGAPCPCSYVELGTPGLPHAVVPCAGLRSADPDRLRALGRRLRRHPAFPKGANVNFFEITGEDAVFARTYERGVEDFTYACGTGAGSIAAVLALQGKASGRGVQVEMTGGTLYADVELRSGQVTDLYLTGPTNIAAKGEVLDEDLEILKKCSSGL